MRVGVLLLVARELLAPIAPLTHRSLQVENVLPPTGRYLAPLLVPRAVGSVGHQRVRRFISDQLRSLGWHVELDSFRQDTPVGPLTFTNIIATATPAAKNRIIVAAHYDSKRFVLEHGTRGHPVTDFIGASDSAWPCALMLELAASLPRGNHDTSLQLVFFDGEEALVQWSESDSIYGAKHLAARWSKEGAIESIKFMLLLDLLGTKDPQFHSFFPQTQHLYRSLAVAEHRLSKLSRLKRRPRPQPQHHQRYQYLFEGDRTLEAKLAQGTYWLEDDHLPFLHLGVPVLHLIPVPFPPQWHTPQDDVTALDSDTCHDLAVIIHSFLAELLLPSPQRS